MSQKKAAYGTKLVRQIISGAGSVDQIGPLLTKKETASVFICTDKGIVQAGLLEGLEKSLQQSGIGFDICDEVVPEPPLSSINGVIASLARGSYDYVIGIGGGSSLDVAKLASAGATNTAPVESFVGIDQIEKKGLPILLVPTTAGTGSEVTPNAIVTFTEQGKKAGAVSEHLVADVAVLDPTLCLGLPAVATAATGLDALIHSFESYIGLKHNIISNGFAERGMSMIWSSIRKAVDQGGDIVARENMLVGSMFGGLALTASGTAAVHALAYAIGAKYGIPHGLANSMLFAPVLERTIDACRERIAAAGAAMGVGLSGASPARSADEVLREIGRLVKDLDLDKSLSSFGAVPSDLDELTSAAVSVERLMSNNPKTLTGEDVRGIFEDIM